MCKILWFEKALLPEGWANGVEITIDREGRIGTVRPGTSNTAGHDGGAAAVPGLVNLHSHAFQRAMAGLTERRGPTEDSFWTWRELMYRFVERLDPEAMQAVAALAYAEMLESGFTRVAEFHYLHHQPDGRPYDDPAEMAGRLAAASGDTGLGLTLLPVFYAHSGFDGAAPGEGQRRFLNDPASYEELLAASRRALADLPEGLVGVAPHSLRAVTEDELHQVVALADGGPIHIHIAEQAGEVAACLEWSGERPVEWLLNRFEADSRWCLVHATHVTDAEISKISKRKSVVGLCPVTEANLGDGIFPARELVAGQGLYGIGTDSNVLIDAAEEMRMLEYSQRLLHRSRNILAADADMSTGRSIFDTVLRAGHAVSGRQGPVGLRAGATADIVVFRDGDPVFQKKTGDDLLDSWIFARNKGGVDTVWSGGKKVVESGRHVHRSPIEAAYRQAMEKLLDW